LAHWSYSTGTVCQILNSRASRRQIVLKHNVLRYSGREFFHHDHPLIAVSVAAYVRKLVEQGVIEKKSNGRYDLDACRSKYLAHLRAERKLSPKGAADTEFTAAKAELIRIRVMEKKRELVLQSDVDELIDGIVGVLLSAMSAMPAQCAPVGDLPMRRRLERWVFETRKALAGLFSKMGDDAVEPLLEAAE
jgi:hypothetical protein